MDCMAKCGHREVTGILLNDPQWLEKEEQLEKCDKCRSIREAANEKARRRSLIAVLTEARRKKP